MLSLNPISPALLSRPHPSTWDNLERVGCAPEGKVAFENGAQRLGECINGRAISRSGQDRIISQAGMKECPRARGNHLTLMLKWFSSALNFLPVYHCKPAQLAIGGWMLMALFQPGREVGNNPLAGIVHWGVECDDYPAALPLTRRPIPGGDDAYLSLTKLSPFVKAIKVIRAPLEILLISLVLHGSKTYRCPGCQFPAMERLIVVVMQAITAHRIEYLTRARLDAFQSGEFAPENDCTVMPRSSKA